MDLLTRMDGRGLRVEEVAVGEKRRTATQPGVAFTVLLLFPRKESNRNISCGLCCYFSAVVA